MIPLSAPWMNRLDRSIFRLLTLLLFLPCALAAEPRGLTLFTWDDYIKPEVIRSFEELHDTKVKMIRFVTEDDREKTMALTSGQGFDLVVVSGVYIASYAKRGWLAELEPARLDNARYLEERWRNAYEGAARYAVPYFWGNLGIAYRRDKVPEKIDSWSQFYHPAPILKGRISMLNDARETMGTALKALGHPLNSTDREQVEAAGRLLMEQKPFVLEYAGSDTSENTRLVTGEAWMALTYNGDALFLQGYNDNIAYVVPKEGTGLWVDYLVMMQNSPQPELAQAFLNHLMEPKMAAANALYNSFATTNSGVRDLLPAAYWNNPLIFPGDDVVSRSEFFQRLSPGNERRRNLVFSRVLH